MCVYRYTHLLINCLDKGAQFGNKRAELTFATPAFQACLTEGSSNAPFMADICGRYVTSHEVSFVEKKGIFYCAAARP